MNKLFKVILISLLALLFVACQSFSAKKDPDKEIERNTTTNDTTEVKVPSNNILVVYFSMPETDNSKNMTEDEENSVVIINGQVLGNTQYIARVIQENTNADIFRIEPTIPYTTDHKALVDKATEERTNNARPEINSTINNFKDYDTIFVGYPIWWSDMPMILYTFFDTYDFADKKLIPFSTHGGSGLADTVSSIKALEPNANLVENAFTVSRNSAHEAESDVIGWLHDLGFTFNK